MTKPKPLEIWLVNFPFSDLSSTKVRPILVWSEHRNEYIILGIFSKIPASLWSEAWVLIPDINPQFPQTGLLKNSLVRADKIATVNLSVFNRQLGIFPSNLLVDMERAIKNSLNLS
jgi:mRNA interferase MazF